MFQFPGDLEPEISDATCLRRPLVAGAFEDGERHDKDKSETSSKNATSSNALLLVASCY